MFDWERFQSHHCGMDAIRQDISLVLDDDLLRFVRLSSRWVLVVSLVGDVFAAIYLRVVWISAGYANWMYL